jgi:hypothetical protein
VPINSTSLWIALGALALGGCFDPADDDPDTVAVGKKSPLCEGDDCGTNGREMYGSAVHRLHLNGVTLNPHDIKYVSFRFPSGAPIGPPIATPIPLTVEKDHFVAHNGSLPITGALLEGGELTISQYGVTYHIWIIDVNSGWTYWGAPANPLESYTFETDATLSGNREPLCDPSTDPLFPGAQTLDAAVFEGSIYDQETLTATQTSMGTYAWFNIACVGTTTLKTLVTRHARASVPGGAIPLAFEQAVVDAYTGNYCGDGRSFTVNGVPLKIREGLGLVPKNHGASYKDGAAVTIEAVWGGDGAVCMNTSRRLERIEGIYDADIIDDILEHCATVHHDLPTCDEIEEDVMANWADHGHVVTAIPTELLTKKLDFVIAP